MIIEDGFMFVKRIMLMRLSHCRMMGTAQKTGSRSKLLVWTGRKKKDTLMLMGTL